MKWFLDGMLDNLRYQSVLDIGGGIGLAKTLCIKREVKTVYSIDPDRRFIQEFLACNDDNRIQIIEENIDSVDLTRFKYDIAFLLLNLPFLSDPTKAIEKIAFNKPDYVVIAHYEIGPEQKNIISSDVSKINKNIGEIFTNYRSKGLNINDVMASHRYYN